MISFIDNITGKKDSYEEENNLDSNLDYQMDVMEDEDAVFDLPIDVYQDGENIYLRAFIPGVKPNQIEINITRDVVEITGERTESEKIDSESYHQRELIWGKFSKKVLLPSEVNVDRVKANTDNGMITMKLPKLDKDRAVKVLLN